MEQRVNNLEDQLLRDEGVRKSVYQDSLGFWTIGVGRLVDARKGGGLSDSEIRVLLANDISRVRDEVARRLPWAAQLDDVRLAVLHNMAFQMGVNGLLGFKNTLEMVRRGDYAAASVGMMQSKWATQTPNRSKRLSEQMRTGEWV